MAIQFTPDGAQVREKFPYMTDEEFIAILREEEAVQALTTYLRTRFVEAADKSDNSSERFPFPIVETAQEIARVVLKSAGSFGFDKVEPPEPPAA